MTWFMGIDEAGYGPNLGPLVMCAVACRAPAGTDLWQALRGAVRRSREAEDERLLVDDSKLVYGSGRGLRLLETGVLAWLHVRGLRASTLADLIEHICPEAQADLKQEAWYRGDTSLPVEAPAAQVHTGAQRLAAVLSAADAAPGPVCGRILCPARFNALVDRWGSKNMVLGLTLVELVRCTHCPDESDEEIQYFIDKQGGRNTYAALLQEAVPEGLVLAQVESRERSVYQVHGGRRPICLTITPRAEAGHLCVALASMLSKYLRELLMREFNHFWQGHLPHLRPTAGYPADATRFLASIRPVADRLGIPEAHLWRRK
jgi:ribonuclease HII